MVVRDEDGTILDPEVCGAVKLFRAHEKSAEVIQLHRQTIAGNVNKKPAAISKNTRSLMMTLDRPVHFALGEELELQFGLFDASTNRFLTDFYIVRLGSNGVAKQQHHPSQHPSQQQQQQHFQPQPAFGGGNTSSSFKVIYTDLGKDAVMIYLVCQVVRIGRMNLKDPDKKGATLDVRRPFGIAVKPVFDILRGSNKEDADDKFEPLPVHLCGERDNFESLVKKIISPQRDSGNRVLKDSLR